MVGLFAGRGFNIDSLAVNVTMDPAFSRIVLTTRGNEAIVEQIVKQLRKLIRVKKVVDVSDSRHIERELCVATVQAAGPKARQELERVVSLTGARVIAFLADCIHRRGHRHIARNRSVLGAFAPARHPRHGALLRPSPSHARPSRPPAKPRPPSAQLKRRLSHEQYAPHQ